MKSYPLVIVVLAACCCAANTAEPASFAIGSPPAELRLSPFYKKCLVTGGYPIVSSENVSDYALKEAAYLVNLILSRRPDLRKAMTANGSRLIIIAHNEFTTDIPEYADLKPKDYWDARARGLGGNWGSRVCSCAEENLLAYKGDPYATESVFIHEFAHNIHLVGLATVDTTFDGRLQLAYRRAMRAGLWKGKYASTNKNEYWAEGVQSWFSNNRPPDHDHNHVDTRQELREYDRGLADLCEEVFGPTKLVYTKPGTRLRDHLSGFSATKSPEFLWPKRLTSAREKIFAEAVQRGRD